jgi:flagellar biogenesis protein FliO
MHPPHFDQFTEWVIHAFLALSLVITLLGVLIWQLRRLLEFFKSKHGGKPGQASPFPKP